MGGIDFIPNGIKAHRRGHVGDDKRVGPCYRFGFRVVHIVLVSVLQGINTVFARRYTTDGELSPAVRT